MNAWSGYQEYEASDRRLRQPPGGGPPGGGGDGGDGGGPSTLATCSGIALTGGAIFNGLAGGNVDAVENELDTLDNCLMHASPTGEEHYHSLSPCIKSGSITSTTVKPGLCQETSDCINDGHAWSRTNWSDTNNYGGVVGIARDGHVIYGPYNADGEIWACEDHDVCNGFFLADNSYGYAATSTFPYIVGCWGPGPVQLYGTGCSNSDCGEGSAMHLLGTSAIALAVSASVLF